MNQNRTSTGEARLAVRIGPVQLGLPISVDVFNAPCTTFAATLGFQI